MKFYFHNVAILGCESAFFDTVFLIKFSNLWKVSRNFLLFKKNAVWETNFCYNPKHVLFACIGVACGLSGLSINICCQISCTALCVIKFRWYRYRVPEHTGWIVHWAHCFFAISKSRHILAYWWEIQFYLFGLYSFLQSSFR